MSLVFEPRALDDMRSFNRKLAWAPRFRISNRVMPFMIQSLLRLSQFVPDVRTIRSGVRIARCTVQADGLSVPVRLLRGPGPARAVVLDFHGGGWAIGNARMNDQLNAELIAACDVAVVSVDYRLATSAPLAAIMDDCLAAARWLLGGGLPEFDGLPVFVLGESAGGHLAAATLLRLKAWPDLLRRIDGAILYYGVYDLAGTPSVHAAGANTLVLHGPSMAASLRLLTPGLTDEQRRAAPASPLYGDLAGLPPAIMVAGERDPLRDDTTLMAARWGAVAAVECHVVPEAPHGFIRFPVRMAAQVRGRVHDWINDRSRARLPPQ
ncbi:alpha/beta hydrolase [Duganella phyllosphaerae]|uniref:Carboxylesterase NlhH n=1 Tax=Duganella phyllosphaerae TaxID=762836 RepID=A0A1E7WZJ0_9BURK|nr:alpha/beta hydrolase [Duganella phyllosphaerae]OFA05450.1 carboxylesterase NlhH [Duganella phyllosphaerae]